MCNIMQIILIIHILSLNCVQIVANIDKIAINLSYLSTILLPKYCYFQHIPGMFSVSIKFIDQTKY